VAAAAPKTGGKKIAGLNPKTAIIVFVVAAAGIYLFMKYRASSTAASNLSTASVPTTGTAAAPATGTDTTGGVAAGPDLSGLLDTLLGSESNFEQLASAVATSPPTNTTYYNAPFGNVYDTTTTTYTGTSPPSSGGQVNPVTTAAYPAPGGSYSVPGDTSGAAIAGQAVNPLTLARAFSSGAVSQVATPVQGAFKAS
jgi:hypothetical protein